MKAFVKRLSKGSQESLSETLVKDVDIGESLLRFLTLAKINFLAYFYILKIALTTLRGKVTIL